jgi:hypothetical protein
MTKLSVKKAVFSAYFPLDIYHKTIREKGRNSVKSNVPTFKLISEIITKRLLKAHLQVISSPQENNISFPS